MNKKPMTRPQLTETYDPATGVWTHSGYLLDRRYSHTANLLPDGRVLVVGGNTDANAPQVTTRRSEVGTQITGSIAP